jgi:hypothetical protein
MGDHDRMSILGRVPLCLLLLGWPAAPGHAQAITSPEVLGHVREAVRELAFDPTRYFQSEHVGDPSIIRITYTGDDLAWPVYSIAIAEGCQDGEPRSPENCGSRLTARMVRSPAPSHMARPRQRGSHIVRELVARRATSGSSIRSNLRAVGIEWLEADLRACPGISSILARSAQLSWVPEEVSNPGASEEISIVLHADIVKVVFDQYARSATYDGYIADGSPAAWAVELAEALEPCWRPARATPPWSR